MKFGIEAEGRFKGLRSIFFENVWEFLTITPDDVVNLARKHGACHVAIMDLDDEIEHEKMKAKFEHVINSGIHITVEGTTPPKVRHESAPIQFVKHMSDPDFFDLQPTDQIKFVDNEKDRNVRMTPVESMIPTSLEAFAHDKEITLCE